MSDRKQKIEPWLAAQFSLGRSRIEIRQKKTQNGEMKFSLFDVVLLFGSVQGLFVALLLYRRQVSNQSASRYLLGLVLLVSLLMFAKVSYQAEWIKPYAEIVLIPDVILFILGPCIWLFARHLLRLSILGNRDMVLHLLPAFFHVLILNTILGQHLNGNWDLLSSSHIRISFLLIEGSAIISLLLYLFKSLRLIQQHEKESMPLQVAPAATQFLPLFFRVGVFITICWSVSYLFQFIKFDPTYLAYRVIWFLLVAYVYWLAYMVLLKTEIFDLPFSPKPVTSADEILILEIKNFMKQQKPYLEPTLKLADLAKKLDISRHELSRLINHGFGLTFFDFINSYRIQKFIELRQNTASSERSIMQLAYEVGFNSKSAFNRAFRKKEGLSPSEYFKELNCEYFAES